MNGIPATAATPSMAAADSAAPAILVEGLECRYGDTVVLSGITFSVRAGELFFVIGGFVMAQSMSKRRWDYRAFKRYSIHRYLRLEVR